MFSSRSTRLVWTINGYLLLLALVIALGQVASGLRPAPEHPDYDRGLVVGTASERARQLDVSVQHFQYDEPSRVAGTPYSYVSVYALDKMLPEEVRNAVESAGDLSMSLLGSRINVVFFNDDQTDVRRLLAHNGYVDRIYEPDCPPQPERSHGACRPHPRGQMLYRIALRDTDGDDRIGERDAHAYFTSDASGRDLRQITPDTLDLSDPWYGTDFARLYFTRVVEEPEGRDLYGFPLRPKQFYAYAFEEGTFERLDGVAHELSLIERDYRERFR